MESMVNSYSTNCVNNCSNDTELDIRANRVSHSDSPVYQKIKTLVYSNSLINQTELDDIFLTLPVEELIDVFYFIKKIYVEHLNSTKATPDLSLKAIMARIVKVIISRFLGLNSLNLPLADQVNFIIQQKAEYVAQFEKRL